MWGVAGVVMIDRDPVELGPEVGLHLLHQVTGGLARIGQIHPFLGRDDETELVPVLAAPVQKGASILRVTLARIDLALLAVLRHAVPFKIAEVRIHRLGADKLPSADSSALRVEFYNARLHRHSPRPCARPAPVPAPRAPILQRQRRRGAPASRVEPAAALPSPATCRTADPVGVAAGLADRDLDLGQEGLRAWIDARAAAARPSWTNAEIGIVCCHPLDIGGQKFRCKTLHAMIVAWRTIACRGVKTAESPTPHIASATHFSIENKVESEESGTPSPYGVLLHVAKNNVQTTSCDRREPRTKVRFILPSSADLFQRHRRPTRNRSYEKDDGKIAANPQQETCRQPASDLHSERCSHSSRLQRACMRRDRLRRKFNHSLGTSSFVRPHSR